MEFGNTLGFAFCCAGIFLVAGFILLILLGLTVITKNSSYLTDGVSPIFIFMGIIGLLMCAAIVIQSVGR